MAEFYKIKVGDLWLSKDGLETGLPCRLTIDNVEDILVDFVGQSYPSASGKRISQLVPAADTEFAIKIDQLTAAVYASLKTLANANLARQASESNANIAVIGTGDTGNFSVNAVFNPTKPFKAESFLEGRIFDIQLKFIRKV